MLHQIMRTFFYGWLLIPFCFGQHITTVTFGTWNTHGANWDAVLDYTIDSKLDVFAVQECGNMPPPPKAIHQDENFKTEYIGGPPSETSLFMIEHLVTHKNHQFYVYHYDRSFRQDAISAINNLGSTQNMAIVTRQRTSRYFILPMIDKDGKRLAPSPNQNEDLRYRRARPTIGVQIGNTVFYNIHAEATDTKNEASAAIDAIAKYMGGSQTANTVTWVVMGDFNRIPTTLNLNGPAKPVGTLVRVNAITHPATNGRGAELDYGVVGGANIDPVNPPKFKSKLMAKTLPNKPGTNIPLSDHLPVLLNYV